MPLQRLLQKLFGMRDRIMIVSLVLSPLVSCSILKLDKDSNCLNEKAACFKSDKTSPQLAVNGAISPTQGQIVSVLSSVDLMFTEELNNPQPADFVFSGAASMTVNAVTKLNDFTYRLSLTQNSLTSGTIYLDFPNLKDYNGNKITGSTTVTYIGNVDIPVTLDSVSHYGVSGHAFTSPQYGFQTIDVSWRYTYVPPASPASTTVFTLKLTTGSTDCSSATPIAPSATSIATGSVVTSGSPYTFSINAASITALGGALGAAGAKTLLICADNVVNNKHGVGIISLVFDSVAPLTTFSPAAGPYASARTLTFDCSDNVAKVIYNVTSTTDGVTNPTASVAVPAFDQNTGAITNGTVYDVNNKPQTVYVGNPTWSVYKYVCIDKAGNIEYDPVITTQAYRVSGIYKIDSNFPTVTLSNVYKSGTTVTVSGVSSAVGSFQNIDVVFTTNQIQQQWEIRTDGAACGSGGTPALSGAAGVTGTPAAANVPFTKTIAFNSGTMTAANTYTISLCVYSSTTSQWGQDTFTLLRDDTAPSLTPNVATGSYGAIQNIVPVCTDNTDRIAYTVATQAGSVAPTAPANPGFDSNGVINSGAQFTTPLATPDASTTTYKWICIDKGGNKSPVVSATYTVDSVLPTIAISSNSHDFLSNATGYTSTSLIWQSTRGGLGYSIRQPNATPCTGAILASPSLQSGTTPTNTSQTITNTFDIGNFGADGSYAIQICVQNFAGQWGYTNKTIQRDIVNPTFTGLTGITSPASGSYTITWPAATDGGSGVAFYRIYQSTTSLAYGTTPDYTVAAPNTSFTVTGLNPATTYYFVAGAVDNAGNETKVVTAPAEMRTRFNLIVNVAGKVASTNPFIVQAGGDTLTFTTNASQTFGTGYTAGAAYSVSVTGQPENQNCAFTQNQYGTVNSDLTLSVTCVSGYVNSGNITVNPSVPLNYMLYRGNAQVIAGSGAAAAGDGTGVSAQFNNPHGMVMVNGVIYISEQTNHRIRKLVLGTNVVSTIAGSTQGTSDGTGAAAQFSSPQGITTDGANLYVADATSGLVRRIVITTAAVTTIAGTGTAGGTTCPGAVTTGCKDGVGQQAAFVSPNDIIYHNGSLYISEYTGNRVRRMDLSTGQVTTIAGDGTNATSTDNANGINATFNGATGAAVAGGSLYVADFNGHRIRKVNLTAPYAVTTVAGSTAGYADGPAATARFNNPDHLTTDGTNLFIGEYTGNRIRRIDLRTNIVSTLAGDGSATDLTGVGINARLNQPVGIVTDGARLYTVAWGGHQVFRISDSGLVAYWPLNGTPTDYNSSGSALNHLTPAGGLTSTTGRYGGTDVAYRFDGTASLATVGNPPSLSLTSEYSISVWVYPTSTSGMRIVDKITSGGCDGYLVDFLPGNQVRFSYCISGSGEVRSGLLVPTGQWMHITATFSSSRRIARIYINGHLDGEIQTAAGTTQTNSLPVRIGADSAGNYKFTGAMAAVRLYDRLLSEGEINELAQDASSNPAITGSGFNTAGTGLISHYTLEAGSMADSGALNQPIAIAAGTQVTGKDGDANGAYTFSAASSQSMATPAMTTDGTGPGGEITVAAWINPASLPAVSGLMPIVTRYASADSTKGYYFELYNSAGTQTLYWSSAGGTSATYTPVTIPLNTWTHVAVRHSGTTATIYVNGTALPTTVSGTPSFVPATLSTPINIGKRDDGWYFNGKIDDVRIYNNALSATQIRQLATQVPAGMVFRMDTNGDATDVSGLGQSLLSNTGSLIPGRTGINNTAYAFSSGQVATFAHSPTLMGQQDMSWSFWMSSRTLTAISTELFTKYNSQGWVLKYDQSNFIHGWTIGTSTTATIAKGPRINANNVWNHYAFVRSGAVMNLYVNGAQVATYQAGDSTAISQNTVDMLVGSHFTGNVSMQDARIYDRALSQAEVQALSGYHVMQTSAGLRLHLQADTFSDLNDNSATGNWLDSAINPYDPNYPSAGKSEAVVSGATTFRKGTNGLNGKPALEFDGSTVGYFNYGGGSAISYSGVTVCTVFTRKGTGYRGLLEKRNTVLQANAIALLNDTSVTTQIKFEENGGSPALWGTVADGVPAIFCAVHKTPNSLGYYLNGYTPVGSSVVAISGANSDPLFIGTRFNSHTSSDEYGGQIAEIIMMTSGAGATDIKTTNCYLSAKYGIPLDSSMQCP